MRILLINPPHPSIGSRIPDDHLPPLGLLSVGGPLIDDGHEVRLLDCEFGPMPLGEIVAHALAYGPDAVLIGRDPTRNACGNCVQVIAKKTVVKIASISVDEGVVIVIVRFRAPWMVRCLIAATKIF